MQLNHLPFASRFSNQAFAPWVSRIDGSWTTTKANMCSELCAGQKSDVHMEPKQENSSKPVAANNCVRE